MDRIARILTPHAAPTRLSPLAPALAALAVVGLALGGVLKAEAQSVAQKPVVATSPARASAQAQLRTERARNEALQVQHIQLMRQLAISQATKGRVDAARQRALQVQIDVLEAQVEAARAQKRANGATYGTPGSAQHPVWAPEKYPQGVGRLIDPKAQDAYAFAQAQAALTGAGSAQTAAEKAFAEAVNAQAIATLKAHKHLPSIRQQVVDLYGRTKADEANVPRVEFEPRFHLVSIDADHSPFADTVRALAKKAKISVIVEMGVYYDVTAVVSDLTVEDAIYALCKAGHADFVHEGTKYYITSKVSAPPSGGGLGGGH